MTQIQLRRGTASAWTTANPIMALGEVGIETDTYKIKVGDGLTAWSSLGYFVHSWSDVTGKPAVIAAGSTQAAARSAISAASLDGNGKVPAGELPNSIMEYQGTWNASTNSPSLSNGTGSAGDVYRVSVAGSRDFGAGSISFDVGDYVIYSGSVWEKSDTTDAVSSVAGRTGAVTLTVADVGGDTSTALGVGSIELGHASDTTLTRPSAGKLAVEGVEVVLAGGALGTPSSGTLTNATGLPVSGITSSTTTALGVGSVELGHATDTTLSRSAAGRLAVEGVDVLLSGGDASLGTVTPATLNASSVGYTGMPANSQSAAYTLVAADAGKHIIHPSSDNNARTFTIPANSSVAYPVGTVITFVNAVNTLTIAITTDTMTLANSTTTGSRTLAANGIATAIKIGSTNWLISGAGLT